MGRFANKAGLAPGTLVYTGPARSDPVRIHVLDYAVDALTETDASVEDCARYRDTPSVTWFNVTGIHDAELIQGLGRVFGLHPLLLEDIMHAEQRPKLEEFDNCLFFVLRMLSFEQRDGGAELRSEQVSLVLGKKYVLMFQEDEGDVFDPLRERIRNPKGRFRHAGNDYLAYSIIDAVVDSYFVILEQLGDRVDALNNEFLAKPQTRHLHELERLKRQAVFLRKNIWPLREALRALEHVETGIVRKETVPYLRDAYDHTVQAMDQVETLRDQLGTMFDLYMSSVSNHMNEIMKVLTIIATIFMPLTFIAGIYGMNFNTGASPYNMPELHWRYGYEFALGVMAVTAATMLYYFHRRGWID